MPPPAAAAPPALSPALVGGLLLRPLPPALLRRLARPVLARAARRLGPRLDNRLDGVTGRVAVLPAGFPVALMVDLAAGSVALDLADPEAPADAVVRAPAEVLLALLDPAGDLDGDAGFFSRALTIEGDTGLVMALRYALEDGGVDTALILSLLPVPLRPLAGRMQRLHAATGRDLATLQQAMLAPLRGDLARQEARLDRLERECTSRRRR